MSNPADDTTDEMVRALTADKECLLHAMRQMFEGNPEQAIITLQEGGFNEEDYTYV